MTDRLEPAQPEVPRGPIIDDAWHATGSGHVKPLIRLPRTRVLLRHGGELMLTDSVRPDADREARLAALGRVAQAADARRRLCAPCL